MWNTLSFENKMSKALERDFGEEKGKQYFTQYTGARDSLIADNFFPQINGAEPSLSDHGGRHIANVLNNVEKLLGQEIESQTGITLYTLGLVVLFHDVGNINGREKHNKNIADVYNFVRKKEARFNRERAVVIRAGEAHCGKSKDGSRDTLNDLDEIDNIDGEKINLRSIAAILRFADELAEGPQRTSQFMIEQHKYSKESEIFHKYASVTHMFIDREGGRVSVTYDIDFDTKSMKKEDLVELLEFSFKRVVKIDEERRYNKHYCDLLTPFKKTTIQYNFTVDGTPINIDLGKIEITDRFPIPGEHKGGVESLLSKNTQLEIDKIWDSINPETKEKASKNV
ncbi:hypothetical protein QWY81_11655 [Polaribacter undariae]|uniref:HD-CE domain-containing protein n=1 Tax=Polaribacter sejongensis TaxID=985043 RepID=A0AAJ1QXU7_9FLAO|nr:hypothetical protein [Polaribacter undariae]MDN3620110.1 hypothetical protein [Polaribacter undariae]UWD32513.1 hypothetical protein NQP51_02305 [Polaribacter undariae]